MSGGRSRDGERAAIPEEVPVWEDEYLDRVSDRLFQRYDLERDYEAGGERFDMYGRMEVHTQKHFFHPSLSYAHHESVDHLFATRREDVTVGDLESYVDLGHDLAGEWIDPDPEHYGTSFSFVIVLPDLPEAVREFVAGFGERELLKFGYHGHYEVHLAVVAPPAEAHVDSTETDIGRAFALWAPADEEKPGLLERLFG